MIYDLRFTIYALLALLPMWSQSAALNVTTNSVLNDTNFLPVTFHQGTNVLLVFSNNNKAVTIHGTATGTGGGSLAAGTNAFGTLMWSTNFTFSISTSAVYHTVTGYFASAGYGCSVDAAAGSITNTTAQWFNIDMTTSFGGSGGAGDIFELGVFTNNVEVPTIEWVRKTGSTDTDSAAGSGTLWLPAGTRVDLRIQNTAATGNIALRKCTLRMTGIGVGMGLVSVQTNGVLVVSSATNINFIVSGVKATNTSGLVDLEIPAGTGDPGGTNARQWGTLALTNLSGVNQGFTNGYLSRQGGSDVLTNLAGVSQAFTNGYLSRQNGTEALTNISGLASTVFTNVPLGGSNISVRTTGGTNFIDTAGQLNNWALYPTTMVSSTAQTLADTAITTATNFTLTKLPAIVTNTIDIAAGAWTPASNGPAAVTITNGFGVKDAWSFDDSANESICRTFAPGPGFNGTLSANIHWLAPTWTSGASNIVWELSVIPMGTNQDDVGGVIFSTGAAVTNRAQTSNLWEVCTLPTLTISSNLSPRLNLSMRLTRHGTNATGKIVGDCKVEKVVLSICRTNWIGGL